ncbi:MULTISPECIES: BglG family transcription antiterminator LicT [Paenibacillus]|jgi:beta-glucoside operon transcriptional antiterminator|uniref:PRD domain-containing protein n=2 Tax=Paenibacillus TaxID=44249 RepID=A0AAJ3IY64_PAEPO|nr:MULTISPECIES: PRD domain-containing protein [Paenibacillus]AHC19859.1 transcription antiterminator BglG [Paenibacillus polymyxa CR1]ALA42108.1 transcription antiterminator BglG [Paenibacillus peoriae]APB76163.1 PRD domain-containing protein [Paenibacillus polymyxa]APQ59299.1 transcription antiterminator BglG [Paenibacillus polymyxa]MCP3745311.1 PRD domain-containing protein [Paenibacillus sp. A3M_27_13]
MILKKALNNNVVLAEEEDAQEVIATGNGIAFNLKPGDTIDERKITKLFVVKTQDLSAKLADLLKDVKMECIEIADEIVEYARPRLAGDISDYIYLALIDHISFAIQRHERGTPIENRFLWEIKRFYREEFAIGKHALEMIRNRINITFDENEAGFIALHFVNARLDNQKLDLTLKTSKVIKDIMDIVKYHFNVEIDEDSWNYNRFVTHLKFFAQRLFAHESADPQYMNLFEDLKIKFPEEHRCVQKIGVYVNKQFEQKLTNDEMMYLMIHISRLVNRTEN